MRVAAPLASSFVVYLLGIGTSMAVFRKARKSISEARYALAGLLILASLLTGAWTLVHLGEPVEAKIPLADPQPANDPIGEARGIHPGRVVWCWDPDATNEDCTLQHNGDGIANEEDDGYFLDKNTDQEVVDRMLSEALRGLTGETTDAAAWNALFEHFNFKKHGLEDTGYTPGEKIFIKINAVSTWGIGEPWGNITSDYDKVENAFYSSAETTPQTVLSALRQLVNVAGVPQEDISVGDPLKYLYNHCYDKWHAEFPDVNYIAYEGGGGRQGVIPTDEPVIFYSDGGSVLPVTSDHIYTVMEEADYLINIPAMKAHSRAGVTLCAKNHFGSHTRVDAQHLHDGLVAPNGIPTRTDMGMYRTQVDMMGHERIGENTLLFFLDGLWAAPEAVVPPTKWNLAPFNDDWTSSIFLSQDHVALESVALDFLKAEYDGEPGERNYPNMEGVDDYLHQAADSSGWPADIVYDPEGDGTPIPSLGAHEHWNNPDDKEYSRNLGTGDGIELLFNPDSPTSIGDRGDPRIPRSVRLEQNYPNPFNPLTTIAYELDRGSAVRLEIFDVRGRKVRTLVDDVREPGRYEAHWDGMDSAGNVVGSGIYIYRIEAGKIIFIRKMVISK
jgi:hypothetical protein